MSLVGAALTAVTGTWLPEAIRAHGRRTAGFRPLALEPDAHRRGYLGASAFPRPRDLLKIRQAYLDGGVQKGRRVVDSAWIALSPATTGPAPDVFPEFYGEGEDGYPRHLYTLRSQERTYPGTGAGGNGGQLGVVVRSSNWRSSSPVGTTSRRDMGAVPRRDHRAGKPSPPPALSRASLPTHARGLCVPPRDRPRPHAHASRRRSWRTASDALVSHHPL
jgi:hypothetical protein